MDALPHVAGHKKRKVMGCIITFRRFAYEYNANKTSFGI
jgi:hypothetical protein